MRIPNNESDDFSKNLNDHFAKIENIYLQRIKPSLATREVDVMLQDGSVMKSSTFDPKYVLEFYRSFLRDLKNWKGVIQEATGEHNRIYCQISTIVNNYTIKGYFGIQFNVLPYYKPDKQVIHLQRQLYDLSTKNSALQESVANIGNSTIKQELKNMALDELEFEDLFERLLQNQELIGKLEEKVKNIEGSYPELDGAERRKSSIISELENLIINLYQVSPNTIDYNRLMQGEEGIIVYFDLETIDKKKGKGKGKVMVKGMRKGNQIKSVDSKATKGLTNEGITKLFDEVVSAL
ncbi:MAG TPA: hypothetical protein VHH33_09735 [Nitrososphaeraceae archaeon]|jgi:hypothetical protein|nr:hypothetical protein [Nitrososphaeraceae archaeon]